MVHKDEKEMKNIEGKDVKDMYFVAGNVKGLTDPDRLKNANIQFLGTPGSGKAFRVEDTAKR